jgi:hypothetical protein
MATAANSSKTVTAHQAIHIQQQQHIKCLHTGDCVRHAFVINVPSVAMEKATAYAQ